MPETPLFPVNGTTAEIKAYREAIQLAELNALLPKAANRPVEEHGQEVTCG